jgi:CRP/FNR family transcriptional regulator, nitrogen fixation regulation protein
MPALAHATHTAAPLTAVVTSLRAQEAKSPLSGFGTVSHYARNNTIFSEGEDAEYSYRVMTGAVRLSKMMPDGRRQIAEFALPGDFFGINWLQDHALTAEALTEVTLICYGRGRLERLGDENREIRAELFSTLRHDLWAAQNHLVILGRQSANERVASFLVQLMQRGKQVDKRAIDIPMTRQDIADYLGLTIETVCRSLTKLKQAGIIDIPSRHEIVVRNTAALRRAAQPEDTN